jgi:hypothetical protein
MVAFKIIIHQIRRSPSHPTFFFGAKFGAIAKYENDMRDMHKVCVCVFFYQKNCHNSRVKKSWPHLNCLFLEVAKKVVGFFLRT